MDLQHAKQAVAANADGIVATAARRASGGAFDKAEAIVRMLLIAKPDHAAAWHLLGAICFRTGNPLGAAITLERCLAINPDYAAAHAIYGELAFRSGTYPTAVQHLSAALDSKQHLSAPLQNWATVLLSRCPGTA